MLLSDFPPALILIAKQSTLPHYAQNTPRKVLRDDAGHDLREGRGGPSEEVVPNLLAAMLEKLKFIKFIACIFGKRDGSQRAIANYALRVK